MMAQGLGSNKMFHELQEAVNRKPVANGLAIIVSCEHSMKWPDHKHLPGARRDLDTMKQAFERLKFATFPILNPSRDELIQVIEAAAKKIQYPSMPDPNVYGRLVFYFSGHGDNKQFIYTHDGAVNLQSEVFPPFFPEKDPHPHLAKVPKFFFLDTCRGSGTDKGITISLQRPSQFQARGGGGEVERTTTTGNYLLACSTSPDMKAFEDPNSGGYWTQELAWQLCSLDNFEMSVGDVLGKVNARMIKKMSDCPSLQQPVLESTLNTEDPIKLLKEAFDIDNHPEKKHHFTESQEVILGTGYYVTQDPEYQLWLRQLAAQFQAASASQNALAQNELAQGCNAGNQNGSVWSNMQPQQVASEGVNTNFAAVPDLVNRTMDPAQYHGTYQHPHGQCSQHSGMTMQNGEPMMLSDSANVCSGNSTFLHAAATPASHHGSQQQGHGGATSNVPQPFGQDFQRYPSDPQGSGTLHITVGQATAGYRKQHSEPTTKHRIPSQANLQGGNEQGYHRGLLNHFQQTNVVSDYHDQGLREKYSGDGMLYQSFLFMKHVSTNKQIIATSDYMPSKSLAKEDAAKKAFEQINALSGYSAQDTQQGRGGAETTTDSNTGRHIGSGSVRVKEPKTPPSSTSSQSTKKESPTAKVWKQRLKEYFEKKLKRDPKIRYESKENPKTGRFTATVYCPEIGMAEGEKECPSKSAAEHSAAYNALKTLGALP